MLLGFLCLQWYLFGHWQAPEPSMGQFHPSYRCHSRSWLRPHILLASIYEASSASAQHSQCDAELFGRLYSPPSQGHHHHSACRVLFVLNHLPHFPYPAHCRTLQHCPDCLTQCLTSLQTCFRGFWWWPRAYCSSHIFHLLHNPMSLHLELALLPPRFPSPHNRWSISVALDCLHFVFPVSSPPEATFQIVSCAMIKMLRPVLRPILCCIHSRDNVDQWTALLISHICPQEVENDHIRSIDPILCGYLVVQPDVGCWKLWTTGRQAESVMSRLICLMNLNKAKSVI